MDFSTGIGFFFQATRFVLIATSSYSTIGGTYTSPITSPGSRNRRLSVSANARSISVSKFLATLLI